MLYYLKNVYLRKIELINSLTQFLKQMLKNIYYSFIKTIRQIRYNYFV